MQNYTYSGVFHIHWYFLRCDESNSLCECWQCDHFKPDAWVTHFKVFEVVSVERRCYCLAFGHQMSCCADDLFSLTYVYSLVLEKTIIQSSADLIVLYWRKLHYQWEQIISVSVIDSFGLPIEKNKRED